MRVISIINYKGGVGKTTLTANLGAELAVRGYKVLLLDLDAQASLTFSFIRPEKWEAQLARDKTIKTWVKKAFGHDPLPLLGFATATEAAAKKIKDAGKLEIVPSHRDLINLDLKLATLLGSSDLEEARFKFAAIHGRLAAEFKRFPAEVYDLILMDCPPNFNIITKMAIAASQFVVIPAKADALSTDGIDHLQGQIKKLVKDYNFCAEPGDLPPINPRVCGVVFTMIQCRDGQPILAQKDFIARVRRRMTVFDTFVRENNTLYGKAPSEGVPVVLQRPEDGEPSALAVAELRGLVSELERRTGLAAGSRAAAMPAGAALP